MIIHASFNNIISKSYIENDYCHNELYNLNAKDDENITTLCLNRGKTILHMLSLVSNKIL